MSIIFEPLTKRIILDVTSVTASQIWVAWIDWVATSDNSKYLPALKQIGGDALGSGLLIPPYIFLLNGWRVKPMEADHDLVITGNLFVEGGGVPVVRTQGQFQVNVNYTVPVQAQAISTAGSSISAQDIWAYSNRGLSVPVPTATEIASATWSHYFVNKLLTVSKFLGLK
jgi:hypothetical protein